MKAKIKAGAKFIIVRSQEKVNILKVDLKGVHVEGIKNPLSIMQVFNSVKQKMWLPA